MKSRTLNSKKKAPAKLDAGTQILKWLTTGLMGLGTSFSLFGAYNVYMAERFHEQLTQKTQASLALGVMMIVISIIVITLHRSRRI